MVSLLSFSLVAVLNIITTEAQNDQQYPKGMVDCLLEVDVQCMKLRALAYSDKLLKMKSLELMDGVRVEYSGVMDKSVETSRALEEKDWGTYLSTVLPKLLKDMSIRINLFPGGSLVMCRSAKENGFLDFSIEADKGVSEGRKLILSLISIISTYFHSFLLLLKVGLWVLVKPFGYYFNYQIYLDNL